MQKGLVLASFGTSHEDTRRSAIGGIERYLSEKTGANVLRAFTSRMVINILRKRGLYVYNEQEAVAYLEDLGMDQEEIFVQSLHLIPGYEYEKLLKLPVAVGPPLFSGRQDLEEFVKHFPFPDLQNRAFIFFGHGTNHKNDQIYYDLDELCPEGVFVVTVEGALGIEEQLNKIEKLKPEEIILHPLMLVAGDHAKNDMAADAPDSLAGFLASCGYKTQSVLKGLGEYESVAEQFHQKAEALLRGDVFKGEYL